MFDSIWQWLSDQLWFIEEALNQIIRDLDPRNVFKAMFDAFWSRIVVLLPAPADLTEVWNGAVTFWFYVRPIYMLAANFINIPVFASAVAFCLLIEAVLTVPRIWRFILKMIPAMG